MNIDLDDLTMHFKQMSDDALRASCRPGALTVVARPIALAELSLRGFEPPAVSDIPNEDYEGDFETVAQFINPLEAQIVCSCLEASGVPALVADANLVQMNSLWSIAVGGVRIRVPEAHVAEAKEVIAAFNRSDYALADDADVWHD